MGNESSSNRRVQSRVVIQQTTNEDEMLAEAFGNMILRAYVAENIQRRIEEQEREDQIRQVQIALRTRDDNGNTVLHLAAAKGDNDAVAKFLLLGADVNVVDNDGDGALNIALIRRHQDTAVILIKAGANLNRPNNMGMQPIHFSVEGGFSELVQFFVAAGVDVNVKRKDGKTCLHLAAMTDSIPMYNLLLRLGAIEIPSLDGKKPYEDAPDGGAIYKATEGKRAEKKKEIQRKVIEACKNNCDSSTFRKLVKDSNININALDELEGKTPLHIASEHGCRAVIEVLVELGARLDITNNLGETALILSIMNDKIDIAHYLIDKGANPNIKTGSGKSALHFAASKGDLASTRRLVEHGAYVTARDDNGNTPLHYAAEKNKAEIIKYLIGSTSQNLNVANNRNETPENIAPQFSSLFRKDTYSTPPRSSNSSSVKTNSSSPSSTNSWNSNLSSNSNNSNPSSFRNSFSNLEVKYSALSFIIKDGQKIVLGEGTYGIVYAAKLFGNDVAVKELRGLTESDSLVSEIQTIMGAPHQNVLPVLAYTKSPSSIVTPLIDGGDLFNYLKKHPETPFPKRLQMAIDAAKALAWMHGKGVVHRDIKTNNLLVDKNTLTIKVADFGMAKIMNGSASRAQMSTKKVGTPNFSAPETLQQEEGEIDWKKADVYSFSITMYEIFTGREGIAKNYASPHALLFGVCRGDRPPIPSDMRLEVKDLITRSWSADPSSRPSMEVILTGLQAIN